MGLWAALLRSESRLDGKRQYIIYEDLRPALFRTRRECREFIKLKYGYIAERPDLQEEPHGWMMPIPVKVKIELAPLMGRENER